MMAYPYQVDPPPKSRQILEAKLILAQIQVSYNPHYLASIVSPMSPLSPPRLDFDRLFV